MDNEQSVYFKNFKETDRFGLGIGYVYGFIGGTGDIKIVRHIWGTVGLGMQGWNSGFLIRPCCHLRNVNWIVRVLGGRTRRLDDPGEDRAENDTRLDLPDKFNSYHGSIGLGNYGKIIGKSR